SERIPAAAGIVNLRYKSCPEMAGQDQCSNNSMFSFSESTTWHSVDESPFHTYISSQPTVLEIIKNYQFSFFVSFHIDFKAARE
ncbi:hypothetical protein, partial [Enterobacter hormaechei]|uniref:hypothetical protein n=1 Tax=Enterobacter hormaechei TaxID=158836 RepID=UPI001E6444E5